MSKDVKHLEFQLLHNLHQLQVTGRGSSGRGRQWEGQVMGGVVVGGAVVGGAGR